MSRLFSIAVPLYGCEHTALVNISQQGCDLVCKVRYIDVKLHVVLHDEQLVFSFLEGLKQPAQLPNKHAEDLVQNTITAITAHLQVA
jgi:hypothetical protein